MLGNCTLQIPITGIYLTRATLATNDERSISLVEWKNDFVQAGKRKKIAVSYGVFAMILSRDFCLQLVPMPKIAKL